MFRYIPEVYVECMLELFQAVSKADPRFATVERLEETGLQHIISFLVQHFNHPMILNPQICDALLQAMGALCSDKVKLLTTAIDRKQINRLGSQVEIFHLPAVLTNA